MAHDSRPLLYHCAAEEALASTSYPLAILSADDRLDNDLGPSQTLLMEQAGSPPRQSKTPPPREENSNMHATASRPFGKHAVDFPLRRRSDVSLLGRTFLTLIAEQTCPRNRCTKEGLWRAAKVVITVLIIVHGARGP